MNIRKREDVLRSITALLAEVNSVGVSLGRTNPISSVAYSDHKLPEANNSQDELISSRDTDAITRALLRIQSASTGSNLNAINALVGKTLNSAVEVWLQQNLADLVEEVVDEQLSRSQNKKRTG